MFDRESLASVATVPEAAHAWQIGSGNPRRTAQPKATVSPSLS